MLQALRDDRRRAGIIAEELWNRVKDQPEISSAVSPIWSSRPFSHCVFTASASFDKDLAAQFTRLMTAMDPKDPICGEIMRLKGTQKWRPGSPDGFENSVTDLLVAQ